MRRRENLFIRAKVLRAILIFLASYLFFLILWIQVKDRYSYAITYIASKLVVGIKDVRFEEIAGEGDVIYATFTPLGRGRDLLIDVIVTTSSYTYNAPLTFAIAAALYLYIKRRTRAYAEAVTMLIAVHVWYVFSLEAKELTGVLMGRGFEALSRPRLIAYQFLGSFTGYMVIPFEPFLIGIYTFLRFRGTKP